MKNITLILISLIATSLMLIACGDENDPTPGYVVVGESYVTLAHVSVSNDEPLAGESITVTIDYVNYPEVPASSITYIVERNGVETVIDTRDESSTSYGEQVYTYQYVVPGDAAPEEVIRFIGEFRSNQMDYPQVEIASIEVQEE